jgi:hypothetical protein
MLEAKQVRQSWPGGQPARRSRKQMKGIFSQILTMQCQSMCKSNTEKLNLFHHPGKALPFHNLRLGYLFLSPCPTNRKRTSSMPDVHLPFYFFF